MIFHTATGAQMPSNASKSTVAICLLRCDGRVALKMLFLLFSALTKRGDNHEKLHRPLDIKRAFKAETR